MDAYADRPYVLSTAMDISLMRALQKKKEVHHFVTGVCRKTRRHSQRAHSTLGAIYFFLAD